MPASEASAAARPACTYEDHDRLRRGPRETWLAETRPGGFMIDDDGGEALELRNCRRCGSTMSRPGGAIRTADR